MIESLLSILGEYNPVQTTRQFIETVNGVDIYYTTSVVADGLAGLDWPWICSAFTLLLCLYCCFRFFGGLFK